MATPKTSIKIKSGEKHNIDPGEVSIVGKSFKGNMPQHMYFLWDQPKFKENWKNKDLNDTIELKSSGHLNGKFTKVDDLKNWCLNYIDTTGILHTENEISIVGHASTEGEEPYNKMLSRRRIKAVENWIKKKFPDAKTTFKILPLGEEHMKETEDENIRQKQRRIDINITIYTTTILLRGSCPKKDEPTILEFFIDFHPHITVYKEKDDPGKITMKYEDTDVNYSKLPGKLLLYILSICDEYKRIGPDNLEDELNLFRDFIKEKYDERMATPV